MRHVTLVVPGPLDARTGGSIYDRRIAKALQSKGWTVTVIELDPFIDPLAPPLGDAARHFAAIAADALVLVDGLAFGALPDIVAAEALRLRLVPIVHLPLAATPGLSPVDAAQLDALERRALASARHVVVTGTGVRARIAEMLERRRTPVTCIPPGIDGVVHRGPLLSDGTLRVLCVANVTWGKGYDILIRSLARIVEHPWTMTCVGSTERDRSYAAEVRALARDLGIDSRIDWTGELGDVSTMFASADLFALATRSETYGMAVAEAVAHGLPVVSTRTGEIPAIVRDGGLLAAPDDEAGFAELLAEAIGSSTTRTRLAAAAQDAALRLPTWDAAADAMDSVLTVVSRG